MTRHPAPATRPRPRRILPALIVLFAVAAMLRLASGLGTALAQNPGGPAAVPPAPTLPAAEPSASPVADPAARLVDLNTRERVLAQREAALAERAALIEAASDRVVSQIAALEAAERRLAATMALADRAAEDDIIRLVAVFEAMSAEQAAAVFAQMDPEFAAGFLARLAPSRAAAVLAGLDPAQAYGLSAILAGRNARVPRD